MSCYYIMFKIKYIKEHNEMQVGKEEKCKNHQIS